VSDQNDHTSSDPLIDEIRSIRADISRQFGDDVRKLCAHLREVQQSMPNPVETQASEQAPAKPRAAS